MAIWVLRRPSANEVLADAGWTAWAARLRGWDLVRRNGILKTLWALPLSPVRQRGVPEVSRLAALVHSEPGTQDLSATVTVVFAIN